MLCFKENKKQKINFSLISYQLNSFEISLHNESYDFIKEEKTESATEIFLITHHLFTFCLSAPVFTETEIFV